MGRVVSEALIITTEPVTCVAGHLTWNKELTMTKTRREWKIRYEVYIDARGGGGACGTTWVDAYTTRGLTKDSIIRRAAAENGVKNCECQLVGIDYIR